ncbi:MAG: hypothetical protein Q8K60_01740 [Parachlamydiaceae bacterium]|nr:hypothetical protein [Parachlamydiaceae bacterium]
MKSYPFIGNAPLILMHISLLAITVILPISTALEFADFTMRYRDFSWENDFKNFTKFLLQVGHKKNPEDILMISEIFTEK